MSSILKIPFNKVREDRDYMNLMRALERGFRRFDIDYYLVGATARDVWMRGVYEVPPKRATRDLDFAIFLKESSIFTRLKEYFIEVEGFVSIKGNAFILIWKDKTQVDLIPFGALEQEGIVTVDGTGFTSMNVEGFKEVYEEASEEIQTEGHKFKVCTLAGIVVLKLIAWDDRPEMRADDIKDIAEIIKNYFHFNSDAIFEHHNDLFTEENDLDEIASQYLGREIGTIISRNQELTERVIGILEGGLKESHSNRLDEYLARNLEKPIDFARSIISHIVAGTKEIYR